MRYAANSEKIKARMKAWRIANPEKAKAWFITNREYRRIYQKKRRASHPEIIRARYIANPQKYCARARDWAKSHRSRVNAYKRKRLATDPVFAITSRLRIQLCTALQKQGCVKSIHSLDLFGCSLFQLKTYIESKLLPGMTWKNRKLWHIDHIQPCISFNLIDVEQ